MKTILTLAEALEKCTKTMVILRLDIQYNQLTETYTGRLTLGDTIESDYKLIYDISENGTITRV